MSDRVCGVCRRDFKGLFRDHSNESCSSALVHDRDKAESENARLREILKTIDVVVKNQAEDKGLWFIAQTAPEGYLQQELRRLHYVIEERLSALEGEKK